MMEFKISGTVVTLVSLADGTTSMYFSNGGGFIGGGQHKEVASATKEFIALAESFYEEMSITTEFPLARAGRVKFCVLTFAGVYTVDAAEDELVDNTSRFASLFTAGNEVIAQVRQRSTPGK
jgi:hypothetical protein